MAGVLQLRRGVNNISLDDGEVYLNQSVSTLQVGSGSGEITLVPLNHLVTGDVILDGNIIANNLTGSGQTVEQIITNQTVGALTAGTTLDVGTKYENIFKSMLTTYIPATIGAPTLRYASSPISTAVREVGQPFSISQVSFNCTADNPNGRYPNSIKYTLSGTDASDASDVALAGTLGASNTLSFTSTITDKRSTAGNVSFSINVNLPDDSGTLTTNAATLTWKFRSWFLASATNIINGTTATTAISNGEIDTALNSAKSWNVTCTSENNDQAKYTYIIYPASYGDLSSIIQNGSSTVLGAFTKIGDYTITNQYSISENIRVYRSNALGAFSNATTLAIS
jgi:hypothetical protein